MGKFMSLGHMCAVAGTYKAYMDMMRIAKKPYEKLIESSPFNWIGNYSSPWKHLALGFEGAMDKAIFDNQVTMDLVYNQEDKKAQKVWHLNGSLWQLMIGHEDLHSYEEKTKFIYRLESMRRFAKGGGTLVYVSNPYEIDDERWADNLGWIKWLTSYHESGDHNSKMCEPYFESEQLIYIAELYKPYHPNELTEEIKKKKLERLKELADLGVKVIYDVDGRMQKGSFYSRIVSLITCLHEAGVLSLEKSIKMIKDLVEVWDMDEIKAYRERESADPEDLKYILEGRNMFLIPKSELATTEGN